MTQLPSVKPAQIKAARTIKKLLTGRLTSDVSSYPLFPGKEANYLRAQIARIACTTVCAPNGLFTADEESGELTKAEEWEALPAREMAQTANWVHRCVADSNSLLPEPAHNMHRVEPSLSTLHRALPVALFWVRSDRASSSPATPQEPSPEEAGPHGCVQARG